VRAPQPWTRPQLAEYVSTYQAHYQGRIQRLLKVLLVPIGGLFAVLGLAMLFREQVRNSGAVNLIGVLVIAFLFYILGLALYIVFSSSGFEREHSVRCDACRKALPVLAPTPSFSWLKPRFLRIDEAITPDVDLRCPHCKALISGGDGSG
jgi:hypothetical protein